MFAFIVMDYYRSLSRNGDWFWRGVVGFESLECGDFFLVACFSESGFADAAERAGYTDRVP